MKRVTRYLTVGVALIAAALGTADAVRANSTYEINATYTAIVNRDAVHVYDGRQNKTHYVWSGLSKFQKNWVDPDTTANPAYHLDEQFSGYCIELMQTIYTGRTYTWQMRALEEAPIGWNGDETYQMGEDRATLLRRLWGSYAGTGDDPEFQVAVWELLAEDPSLSGPFSVTSGEGEFYLTRTNEVDVGLVNTMLDSIVDPGWSGTPADLQWAMTSQDTQDFAVIIETSGSPPPVPEPTTVAGLVLGSVGLVRYIRRRRGA
jgi:hypothetical protein